MIDLRLPSRADARYRREAMLALLYPIKPVNRERMARRHKGSTDRFWLARAEPKSGKPIPR